MLDPKFIKGEKITCKDDTGRVNFIDKKYITITTNEWEDSNTLSGNRQTNVLVYPTDYDKIIYHERE